MSNQKKTLLKDLTLDDLLSGLNDKALLKAHGKKKDIYRETPEEKREKLIAEAAKKHIETQKKISPWIPEAAVLCLVKTTCTHCQASFTSPASESLLIRFRNRRDGSTWETANHPSQLNPDLPREQKVLEARVHACHHCYGLPSVLDHYMQQQLMEEKQQ